MICNLGDPMSLRHPVPMVAVFYFRIPLWVSECTCDKTHPYMWHDLVHSSIHVTWLMHTCDMPESTHPSMSLVYSSIHVTWLIHTTLDSTYPYMWQDLSIHMTWLSSLIHTCDMTHPYMWHDLLHSSIHVLSLLIHTCDMTHPYMWHDPFAHLVGEFKRPTIVYQHQGYTVVLYYLSVPALP